MAIEKVRPNIDRGLNQNFGRFTDMLDRFFDDTIQASPWTMSGFVPQVDVSETKTHYHYQVSVPGMKKEDISINVNDNLLTISGERKFEDEKKEEGQYHLVENRYGSFSRTLTLPGNADADNIEAKYENGILDISVKKTKESSGKEIKVK